MVRNLLEQRREGSKHMKCFELGHLVQAHGCELTAKVTLLCNKLVDSELGGLVKAKGMELPVSNDSAIGVARAIHKVKGLAQQLGTTLSNSFDGLYVKDTRSAQLRVI
jgi:hypothetical protein